MHTWSRLKRKISILSHWCTLIVTEGQLPGKFNSLTFPTPAFKEAILMEVYRCSDVYLPINFHIPTCENFKLLVPTLPNINGLM